MPGSEIAKLANLVICNGGSPSTQQALQQSKPVLGIPSNLDQLLNMQFIVKAGAGLSVRADQVSRRSISRAIQTLLHEPAYTHRAQQVAGWFNKYCVAEAFNNAVHQQLETN
jgi:UDP:flavonoid glycosyltransferase YjiC (YdhE family)